MILETEIRRKSISRTADSVLKPSTRMSAKNTFFAELVRLPSIQVMAVDALRVSPWPASEVLLVSFPQTGLTFCLIDAEHKRSFPCISEDLFEAFNLTGIAAEVARTLPNGEKNAIRKTYKGHIKKLGVNGHFDSVKRDENDPNYFLRLVTEENSMAFQMERARGKDTLQGLSDGALEKLPKAMTMAKGPIPKSEWDSSVLGDLAADRLLAGRSPFSSKGTAPNTPLHPAVSRPKGQPPLAQEAARPRRSVKKRSYGDNSFEGYGEGFPDDDGGADTGYSTGEGDDRGASRTKQKKVLPGQPCHEEPLADTSQNPGPTPFAAGPVRQSSYGPGMVGA